MNEKKIIMAMDAAIKEAQARRDEAYRNNDSYDARYWGDNIEGREAIRRIVLQTLGALK